MPTTPTFREYRAVAGIYNDSLAVSVYTVFSSKGLNPQKVTL